MPTHDDTNRPGKTRKVVDSINTASNGTGWPMPLKLGAWFLAAVGVALFVAAWIVVTHSPYHFPAVTA